MESNNQSEVVRILKEFGYEDNEIDVQGSAPNGDLVVRVGYWERLDTKCQLALNELVEETPFDDDECGVLYAYFIK